MLQKDTLITDLEKGFKLIYEQRAAAATTGKDDDDVDKIIADFSKALADVIADSVEKYVKSGDIVIGPTNIKVQSTAPGSFCVVVPDKAAKLK